jgi:cytochrome P450
MVGTRLFDRRVAPVARLLAEEIGARQRLDDTEGGDILACMLHADPPLATDEIVEELIPVLMAGQEPPAVALTWLLDRLGREPHAAERFAFEAEEEAPWREAIERAARARDDRERPARGLRAVRLKPPWPQPERMVVRGTVLVPHRSGVAVARL